MLGEMLERIRGKGWSPYEVLDHEPYTSFIPRGPASALECGRQYLVLPTGFHILLMLMR